MLHGFCGVGEIQQGAGGKRCWSKYGLEPDERKEVGSGDGRAKGLASDVQRSIQRSGKLSNTRHYFLGWPPLPLRWCGIFRRYSPLPLQLIKISIPSVNSTQITPFIFIWKLTFWTIRSATSANKLIYRNLNQLSTQWWPHLTRFWVWIFS